MTVMNMWLHIQKPAQEYFTFWSDAQRGLSTYISNFSDKYLSQRIVHWVHPDSFHTDVGFIIIQKSIWIFLLR